MTPRATTQPTGGTTSAENPISHAHKLLANRGIALSPSKVSRLVREFQRKAAPHGADFDQYMLLAAGEAHEASIRQLAGQVLTPEEKSGRPTVHSDHQTGEPATWNVFTQRDLPELTGGTEAGVRHERT